VATKQAEESESAGLDAAVTAADGISGG